MTRSFFFMLKSLVFLLLSLSFLFEFLRFYSCFPRINPTSRTPPRYSLVCCLSVPPKRESLESVKKRLTSEQKARTERRVSQLLEPRQRRDDTEVLDDSEKESRLTARENRLTAREFRRNRDQATQTDSAS